MCFAKVLIHLLLVKPQDVLNRTFPAAAVHVFEHLNRNMRQSNLAVYSKSSNMKPHRLSWSYFSEIFLRMTFLHCFKVNMLI